MLEARDLYVRYGSLTVLDGVSFNVDVGDWLMIVGPNGAGKSTIINAVTQCCAYTGQVLLNGTDVKTRKPNELAREMGTLAQNHYVGYSFTVEEVVSLGRYAYSKGIFSARGDDDEFMVERALAMTGMADLRKQSVLTLSGGELQRTFLAQAFAQNPKLLLLDEPTNHLDLKYQRQIFSLIREWLDAGGRAVASVVHDLNIARAYGTRALMLDGGRVVSLGGAKEVLNRENLQRVYDMDVYGWMRQMLSQWQD